MSKLPKLQQAIVVAHIMRRFMTHYKSDERTKSMQVLSTRLSKFLKQRQRTNLTDFIQATELEKGLWDNVTNKYDKDTRVFVIDFIVQVHGYFSEIMTKYANVSDRLMLDVAKCNPLANTDSATCIEIESNDSDLLSTFLEHFYPYSGVKKRVSIFSGKKLTIKNNLILEGKELSEQFV